jgi:uncharacterized tellurite resistance protein B-like protein
MTTEDDLASFFSEDIDNIVADPEKFRKKLGIGLDAFKLLSKADKLDGFLSSAAVGGAGALGVFAAWSSSLGVLGSIGASIGLVATPIGWMALAGGAGLATSYGIKRLLGSAKQGAVTEIPNFINTPIDVLGGSICDVLTPILLKIAYADNDFSVEEKETIVNYFTDQWGINPSYIENLISEIGNEFTEFNYAILADSLKELAIESGDIQYDDMVKEIISAAEEVMTSDGIIDERETQEIEKLKLAFITAKPNIKKKLSNALETTATGFNSIKTASSNLVSKSSELTPSGLGRSIKLASKTGASAINNAQSLKGIFSKKTKTKDGVKYKKKKVTAEIENE